MHDLNKLTLKTVALLLLTASPAYALDEITHTYESIRSNAMGGVLVTTGLYDENFFGNPARVTANSATHVGLPIDFMGESTIGSLAAISPLISAATNFNTNTMSNIINALGNNIGTNIHERFQMVFPAAYFPLGDKMNLAFGLILANETNLDLTQSYQNNLSSINDAGFAVTVGRKFLKDDALSVGVTGHLTYRFAATPSYTIIDALKKTPFPLNTIGADGSMFDFDLGMMYRLPTKLGAYNVNVGASVDNALGGGYSNLGISFFHTGVLPPGQPRTGNVGVSLTRDTWGNWYNTVFAFEIRDIGNDGYGSPFRLLHMGAESRFFNWFIPRFGINQGYLCGGVGIDLKILTLDATTYGEEMSLNAGGLEDRRVALRVQFQI